MPAPIPVAMRSKVWVWGRLVAGIAGSNPTEETRSSISLVVCFIASATS